MTNRVYANGVKATAVANIKADLAGFISFNADGVKVVDVAGITNYLSTQFALISTDGQFVSPATAASSAAAARDAPVATMASLVDQFIGVNHWNTRPDWPTVPAVLTGATLVSAINSARAECDRAAQAINDYYSNFIETVKRNVTAFFHGQALDAVVPQGVVRIVETRSVIYTYVTDKDEESAPSPASDLVELDQNDTASYTAASPPTGRFVNRIRWYRSLSSNTGANFDFVAESDVGSLTYVDSKKAEELQEPCPTTTWAEPPATLTCLTEGPNGGMGGIIQGTNQVAFCESFVGYAWPVGYRKTTAWPPVGMGRFGQTYVVLTRGKPYYMTGADSASLDSQPIDSNQACVSRRSIVNVEGGVIFASPDGICLADSNGVRLISEAHFTRENWQALNPSSIFATEREGAYIFHYDTGTVAGCYSLDLKTGKLGTINATGSSFYRDLVTDTTYLASGTAINSLFTGNTNRSATWKSPRVIEANYRNYGWLQVDSDFESAVTVKLSRNGVLTDTVSVTSRLPVRVSAGRALEHEVQVESAAKITGVTLASSSEELRSV